MDFKLVKTSEGETPKLSFAQERVWFLQQFEPHNPAYNRPLAMRLRGHLNFDALEQAWLDVQGRHETLRAKLGTDLGKPTLHISESALVGLNQQDLSGLPINQQPEALTRELQAQTQRVFNLLSEPIARAALFRLSEDDHVLSLVFHHLVFDRWSEEVFRKEIGHYYRAHLGDQLEPLPDLEFQYTDFSRWQQRWIDSEVAKQQGEYWRQRLSGDLPTLILPIDAKRPLQRTFKAETVFFRLSADLSRLIQELSRQHGVTIHSTLLTAFLVLLQRYSSQEDILIGIPVAGRALPETEPLIGLFVNTLAARYDLSGHPSVKELLQRVSRTTVQDLSHQEYPFELIVQAINPSRDLRTTPIFQVLFNYENVPPQVSSMLPLRVEEIEYDTGLSQFDLTLEIHDHDGQLSSALSFNQDIFERATIERMAGHYRTLLEGFVADSQAVISDLPLLTQTEIYHLVEGMRSSIRLKSDVKNLQSWFESQVDLTPQAVALEFEGQTLTYADLNMHANRLAHKLIELGVGTEKPVALCLEPSLNMVVGILAILKAGGAYVPLDPDYPRQRLQFMILDAEIDLVVTEESYADKISQNGLRILALDLEKESLNSMPDENPQVEVGTQNLAYVLYTSGSTGKPKGVLITHGNVIQLFRACEERFRFGAQDTWALFHSFTFDFSVWELFGALLYGGRLIVIPIYMRRALDVFFQEVVFDRLTNLAMIPPLFFEAARMPRFYERLRTSNLRHLFLGGDLLNEAELKPFYEDGEAGDIHVFNIYGPTETTVFASWHEVALDLDEQAVGSVIGRPLKDVSIFIVDPDLNLMPAGIPGEIVIGGPGMARGYLNRPEVEKKVFIHHPLDPRPGTRFYRTGDLGRQRADGVLEFLGRRDAQVKIRGFRVELEEIEAALKSHTSIAEAVVKLINAGTRDEILAAYVIFEQDKKLQRSEMRDFLRDKLPEFMIPTALRQIQSIPVTSIGKLDRSLLPDPGPRERGLESELVEPRTELEARLGAIWMEVLGVRRIGVHDSFFDLGGHSLIAMQLVARVREQLSVELNIQDVFGKGRTVAGMAEVIETQRWLSSGAEEQSEDDSLEQGRI